MAISFFQVAALEKMLVAANMPVYPLATRKINNRLSTSQLVKKYHFSGCHKIAVSMHSLVDLHHCAQAPGVTRPHDPGT